MIIPAGRWSTTARTDPLRVAVVAALVLAVVLIPVSSQRVPGTNIRISLVTTALPAVLAMIRAIGERRWVMTAPLAGTLLLVASAVAALPGDPAYTGTPVVETYTLLAAGCVWALVQVCEPPDIVRLLQVFTVTCGVVAVIALTAQSAPVTAHAGGTVINGRLDYPFAQPNELGEFCAISVPISLVTAWYAKNHWLRLLYAGCGTLNAVALALSYSRGGWMGASAALIVLAVLLPPLRKLVATCVASVVTIAVISLAAPDALGGAFGLFGDRLMSLSDGSDGPYDRRPQYWDNAWQMADQHPFFGMGPDSISYYTSQFWSGVAAEPADHAHNISLTILAEQGTFGIMALFLLHVAVAIMCYRVVRLKARFDSVVLWSSAAPLAALAAVFVHGLSDMTLRNPIVGVAVSMVLGLASASPFARFEAPPQRGRRHGARSGVHPEPGRQWAAT